GRTSRSTAGLPKVLEAALLVLVDIIVLFSFSRFKFLKLDARSLMSFDEDELSEDSLGLVGDARLGAELERGLSVAGGLRLIEGRDALAERIGVTCNFAEDFF